MARKYRLEPEGEGLYRVIAARDFKTSRGPNPEVKEGERGGLVSGPYNLSQRGRCWIEEGAKVTDQAKVLKDGLALENATVSGRAVVTDLSWVAGSAQVQDNARIQEVEQWWTRRCAGWGHGEIGWDSGRAGGRGTPGEGRGRRHGRRQDPGAGDKTQVGGNAVISGKETVVTGDRYIIKGITKTEMA